MTDGTITLITTLLAAISPFIVQGITNILNRLPSFTIPLIVLPAVGFVETVVANYLELLGEDPDMLITTVLVAAGGAILRAVAVNLQRARMAIRAGLPMPRVGG